MLAPAAGREWRIAVGATVRPDCGNSASPTIMSERTCLAIVLAAGEGTRMRASLPKALHAVGGRSLLRACAGGGETGGLRRDRGGGSDLAMMR